MTKIDKKIEWQKSISTKIKAWIFLVLFSLLTISYYSMNNLIHFILDKKSSEVSIKAGNLIISEIEENLLIASGLAQSLANLANALPHDEELFMSSLPSVIDIKGQENFIAGGGIWHAPFQFDSETERRSFFWGRNKENGLDYFDDYNTPKSKGYHYEEWYVPAKHIGPTTFYWSQSYTDPFSQQPMVTVTKPFYKQGKFNGVSTVDIKLKGLKEIIEAEAKSLGGKAILLDRKGGFISFPNNLSHDKKTKSPDNETDKPKSLVELAQLNAKFKVYLDAFNQVHLNRKLTSNKQLAKELAEDSYQINEADAVLIAQLINASETDEVDSFTSSITIAEDPLFNQSSQLLLFTLPNTHWTLALIIPSDILLASARKTTNKLILNQLIAISFIIFSIFFILQKFLTKPLLKIIEQIQNSIQSSSYQPINYTKNDELGVLSGWFNKQSSLLKQSEEQMRSLFDLLPDSVILFDHETLNIVDFNTEAHSILGYSRNEFKQLNYEDLQDKSQDKTIQSQLNYFRSSNSGIFETTNTHKNGKTFERRTTFKVIDLNNKKIFLSVFHDLSEQKQAEKMRLAKEAAEIANISKSTFLANMSHEFRTPMHGILSFANMGLKRIDKLTPEKTEKYFTNIKISADRLMIHLNDLLDLAKLEAGKMELTIEPYQITKMLDICIAEQNARMKELKIGKNIISPAIDIIGEMDSQRIGQVITNFISNAIKFSPENTSIDFTVSASPLENTDGQLSLDGLLFSVRDYGKGIPEQELELVFDKFTQSSDTEPGTTKGTGLGLPICKEIIDLHSGKVWAENHPNGGAIFTFIIPLKQVEKEPRRRKEDS